MAYCSTFSIDTIGPEPFLFIRLLECICELFNCCLSDRLLNMEVMLGHIDIGMANDTLNCRKVNAQGLQLRYVGMAATVRR